MKSLKQTGKKINARERLTIATGRTLGLGVAMAPRKAGAMGIDRGARRALRGRDLQDGGW